MAGELIAYARFAAVRERRLGRTLARRGAASRGAAGDSAAPAIEGEVLAAPADSGVPALAAGPELEPGSSRRRPHPFGRGPFPARP